MCNLDSEDESLQRKTMKMAGNKNVAHGLWK